jgi:porphobilinogen synthase
MRAMVRETHLRLDQLVYPLFVTHGRDVKREIASMPQNYHWSPDRLVGEVEEIARLGLRAVLLFGIPAAKDARGSEAFAEDGIVQQAVRRIKAAVPEMIVITDVCLCEYTDHGHCGVIHDGRVLNDPTLDLLARTAVSHAAAGADIVAPSDMMDGRVGAIRAALDQAGLLDTSILSYAAKYASAFYGPFRDAAGSTPQFGDRRSYQMDPANRREALREVFLDIEQGADMIMVKPALPYLDVIREVRDAIDLPVAAYNVSGEYAMVKAAAANGWLDEERAVREILTGIRRAGADIILTYHARLLAQIGVE